MLFNLLKLARSYCEVSRSYGIPVSRNPIAWVPFVFTAVVCSILWLIFSICAILLMPVILPFVFLQQRSLQRKSGIVIEDGIQFSKAYGRLTIRWSEITEVVRMLYPTPYYIIARRIADEKRREYVMSSTADNSAFERTLRERNIPLKDEYEEEISG